MYVKGLVRYTKPQERVFGLKINGKVKSVFSLSYEKIKAKFKLSTTCLFSSFQDFEVILVSILCNL